jgi:predicted nucleic acid-binding protein
LDAIDPEALPASAMLDSSVLMPALNKRSAGDPASERLLDALIENECRVLIAAPTAAEFYRRVPTKDIPRTQFVEVVAFDALAALELGKRFPPEALTKFAQGAKAPLNYIKYDAMIVACAVRHRAVVLISTDGPQRKMASHVGLIVKAPSDFLARQTELYDEGPKRAAKKRKKRR